MSKGEFTLIDKLVNAPNWVKYLVGFVVFCLLDGVSQAWGEKNYFSGVVEASLAVALFWGIALATFGMAVYGGTKVASRSSSNFWSWIVGLVIFTLFAVVSGLVIAEIPGVGWRYKALMGS
ncbi:hypothetical protein C4G68_RS22685 [Vibrio parahaemolyticus]|nr:hypothetical protein [Vibrio parahaemolyticus]